VLRNIWIGTVVSVRFDARELHHLAPLFDLVGNEFPNSADVYSWTFGFSVRCADTNRPLPPLSQMVPNDIAPNLFNSVGTVEISEYRQPNSPILTARHCPS
jgi:hypothetical protein